MLHEATGGFLSEEKTGGIISLPESEKIENTLKMMPFQHQK